MWRQGLAICFSVFGLSVTWSSVGLWRRCYLGFNVLVLINLNFTTSVLLWSWDPWVGIDDFMHKY